MSIIFEHYMQLTQIVNERSRSWEKLTNDSQMYAMLPESKVHKLMSL